MTGFNFGVWLQDTTRSHVAEMLLTGNAGGMGLEASSNNLVKGNLAVNNSVFGINLQGWPEEPACERNHITRNVCNDNGLVGIYLAQYCFENRLVNNTCNGNNTHPAAGFLANGGIALGHPAFSDLDVPDELPRGNIIVANTALGNVKEPGFDLFDITVSTEECANIWRGNAFKVDGETGADAGPGAGCIR